MDDQQKADLVKFIHNLELIAKALDLSSHQVRSAFGRQPLFHAKPDLKDKFLDVVDTLNHLLESCKEINPS